MFDGPVVVCSSSLLQFASGSRQVVRSVLKSATAEVVDAPPGSCLNALSWTAAAA